MGLQTFGSKKFAALVAPAIGFKFLEVGADVVNLVSTSVLLLLLPAATGFCAVGTGRPRPTPRPRAMCMTFLAFSSESYICWQRFGDPLEKGFRASGKELFVKDTANEEVDGDHFTNEMRLHVRVPVSLLPLAVEGGPGFSRGSPNRRQQI